MRPLYLGILAVAMTSGGPYCPGRCYSVACIFCPYPLQGCLLRHVSQVSRGLDRSTPKCPPGGWRGGWGPRLTDGYPDRCI